MQCTEWEKQYCKLLNRTNSRHTYIQFINFCLKVINNYQALKVATLVLVKSVFRPSIVFGNKMYHQNRYIGLWHCHAIANLSKFNEERN